MIRYSLALFVCLVSGLVFASTGVEDLRARMDEGRYADAAALAETLLPELERSEGTTSALYLEVLRRKLDSLSRSGHSTEPEVVEGVRRLLALTAEASLDAKDHSEMFRTASMVSARAGDMVVARGYMEAALEVAEAGLPESDPTITQLRGNLSIQVRRLGDLQTALALGEKATAACDREPFRSCYTIHLALAQTYRAEGRLPEAAQRYRIALAEAQRVLPADHAHIPIVRHGLVIVETEYGRYDVAREELELVVKDLENSLGSDHPRVADAKFSLGVAYRRLGNIDQAERLQNDVLRLREARLADDAETLGYSFLEWGMVLRVQGRNEEACSAFRKSLVIFEKQFEPTSGPLAKVEMEVALCELNAGETTLALERVQRSFSSENRPLAEKNVLAAAKVWSVAGEVALARGRMDEAGAAFRSAIARLEEGFGEHHPALAGPLCSMASAEWQGKRPLEALKLSRRAEELVLKFGRGNLAGLTEAESIAFLPTFARTDWIPFSGLVHGVKPQNLWTEAAWKWALGRHRMVFDNAVLRRRMAGESVDMQEAWQQVVETRKRLAAQWVAVSEKPAPERDAVNFKAALEESESAERRLASLSKTFRQGVETSRIGLDDVVRALPDGHALVEIVRSSIRSVDSRQTQVEDIALILLPGGEMRHARLGPSEDVDRAVLHWRTALEAAWSDESATGRLRQTGERLREKAWDPIAAQIGSAKTVLLIPEGALHQVPFGALPDAGGGRRFLLETGPRIHILGDARDVVRFTGSNTGQSGEGLLALADPDFGASVSVGSDADRSLSPCAVRAITGAKPLPASRVEARRIRDLFEKHEPVELLLGATASEHELQARIVGNRIVHLATHGYFVPETCEQSDGTIRTTPPLLRSGLLVSRDEKSDGVVTAAEVALWDLEGTELVVLSACDTGKGEVAVGEGVFGLHTAFERAGAASVVMSLWSVPDRQALQWMTTFYGALRSGAPAGEAADHASRTALAKLRRQGRAPHPWLWTGFVTAGDWH